MCILIQKPGPLHSTSVQSVYAGLAFDRPRQQCPGVNSCSLEGCLMSLSYTCSAMCIDYIYISLNSIELLNRTLKSAELLKYMYRYLYVRVCISHRCADL